MFSHIILCIAHALLPKKVIVRLAHRIARPPNIYILHCAGIAQGLEVIDFVALLRQFAQAQTALYCIAHAQTV